MDEEDWETVFLNELTSDPRQEEDQDENSDCAENDLSADLEVEPQIKTYKEAIVALEGVVKFL